MVATADGFQGSEREYMVVSTVRTSHKDIQFAINQKRLNVMLTRGKILTVVITNKSMFEGNELTTWMKNHEMLDAGKGCKAIRGLILWAEKHGGTYCENNWATMFQANSQGVNSVRIGDSSGPETFSRTKEWIQLKIKGNCGLKRITIVKGKWTGEWLKIPVESEVKLSIEGSRTLTHITDQVPSDTDN